MDLDESNKEQTQCDYCQGPAASAFLAANCSVILGEKTTGKGEVPFSRTRTQKSE